MRRTVLVCLLAISLASCLKRVQYPDRPDIELIGVTVYSPAPDILTSPIGAVTFSFTDGDGDLGLNPGDTLGEFANGQPYHKNLFVRYFEKVNGAYVENVGVSDLSSARFISLTPTGADKTLEGEMEVQIFADPFSPNDTIRYEMYIVDRALHHSDTIVTPDLINPF